MDAVDRLCQEKSPLRRAFGEHLAICCEALKAIEWVDSGDWPKSQEVEAIQKALCDEATQHIVDAVENRLAKLRDEIDSILLSNKPITTTATHEES